ncbi:helix-turn-helix domain-containing protein [Ruminococcus bicirculans (ex Wegman et al. 2014)]|uniref:helix-turn-helix domain-containing protein n=1 Tax=Ruminococcus bicirculans (ex Wegman et al. 2014) TaxID=1160721 RepID=UPI0022E5C7C4|nr:helix-turn-helix transcriptional regulator [Ruminococcus bicirculans (ex Wegman et al. 2014)]
MKKRVKSSNVFGEKQKLIIAKILINLRELNFLTQTDIAKHLHLSPSTSSHYEKGLTVPPTEVVYRLAEFYNVTTDYILGKSASKTNLNETYAIKLTNKMTIGDAVEIITKMNDTEREHLAYFIEMIGKSKD